MSSYGRRRITKMSKTRGNLIVEGTVRLRNEEVNNCTKAAFFEFKQIVADLEVALIEDIEINVEEWPVTTGETKERVKEVLFKELWNSIPLSVIEEWYREPED